MNQESIDPQNHYKPEVKMVDNLGGFSLNYAKKGEPVNIQSEAFLSSYEYTHKAIISEILRLFIPSVKNVNDLLVIIRNNEAKIYRNFPLCISIRSKVDLQQFQGVFKKNVLDIEIVTFKDINFEIDIKDNDKILWLFRNELSFGLYFDFSGNLKTPLIFKKLGKCFRDLEFYSVYSFFKESEKSKTFFENGWFPFVQLVGDGLDRLINAQTTEISNASEYIVNAFDKERIQSFTEYWWRHPIFKEKKNILNAGISAFLKNDKENTINCIKNLIPEIEGILRLSYHSKYGTKPKMFELKKHLIDHAKIKFATDGSLGFPGLFMEYLNNVIFKDFDLENDDVSLSRHSVGHGVASENHFTRERALQCILTLDQIYFYLGNINEPSKTS